MTVGLPALLAILAAGPLRVPGPIARDLGGDVRPAGLPSRIGRDFARLGSTVPLRVLGAGAALAAASHPADRALTGSLSASPPAEAALDGGSALGSAAVQFGIAGAVYGVGLATRNETAAGTGTVLLEAQVVGGVMAQGLKYAVNRTRPDGGRYSFPSGHTESAFVTADVLLQRFGWKAGVPAYAGAVYVGVARIAEREHYLSDVVFGAAIGIASARAVGHQAGSRSVRIAPVVMRHGAAVFVAIGPVG